MTAASAAWDTIADDLYWTAVAFSTAVQNLTSLWLGPSSLSMAAAAATHVAWISATAMQAEQTAAQAKAAVGAYEAAFVMTVPPPTIAANRALLLALVATNFFGQNTSAIMATESDYVEMWAQDAGAMYGYAAASSAATTMTPFTTPLQTVGSSLSGLFTAVSQAAGTTAGTSAQTVSPLSAVAMPSALQGLVTTMASSTSTTSPLPSLPTLSSTAVASGTSVVSGTASSASALTSGVSMLGSAGSMMNTVGSADGALGSVSNTFGRSLETFRSSLGTGIGPGLGTWSPASVGDVVTAASGRAASLGVLSVPQNWTSAAPAFSQVAPALPAVSGLGPTRAGVVPSGQGAPFGPPLSKVAERQGPSAPETARYRFRPAVLQRPVYTG